MMQVGVFSGTIELQETHIPSCPPSGGGSLDDGNGGMGDPHSEQNLA